MLDTDDLGTGATMCLHQNGLETVWETMTGPGSSLFSR